MRQSILVGEPVCTSIPDDILVVVHINPVQSDWWWASPGNIWLVGMVSKWKKKNDCQLSHSDRLSGTARPDILNNINTMKRRASVYVRWHQRTKRVAAVVLVNMKTGAKFPSTLRKHHLCATTRSCHNHVLVSSQCNLHTLMQGNRIASHTAIDAPCSRRATASVPSRVGNTCFGLLFEQATWMLYRSAVSSLNSPFLLSSSLHFEEEREKTNSRVQLLHLWEWARWFWPS